MLIFFSISHPGKQKMVHPCRDDWALTRTFSVNRKKYDFFITSKFKRMIKSFLLHFNIVVHCLCFLKVLCAWASAKNIKGRDQGCKKTGEGQNCLNLL